MEIILSYIKEYQETDNYKYKEIGEDNEIDSVINCNTSQN